MNSKLLLIDGNSLFHRAYHALPPLTTRKGEMVNAVFGFSNMLLKALNEVKPTHVACAFDTQAPTFRHIEFEAYKAQRVEPPPDLYPQLPKVKSVLDAFGIVYFEKDGYEADDLIATIAVKALKAHPRVLRRSRAHPGGETGGMDIIILSGDRDCLQLVDGGVRVQMPGWNLPADRQGLKETTLYGPAEVKEKYGLETHQMVDFKALTGDPSDNVPGIVGIGPKTASQLLQKYQTLENLFRHVKDSPLHVREKLEAGKDVALAAKKLVELDRDVGIEFELGKLEFKPDWDQVRAEFADLGFKSIVAKLPQASDRVVRSSGSQDKGQSVESGPTTGNKSDQLELI